MVEQVVSVEAELRLDAFSDGKVLRQRHVIVESMGATKRIVSRIADLPATRKSEGTGGRTCEGTRIDSGVRGGEPAAVGKRRDWCEPVRTTLPAAWRGTTCGYIVGARAQQLPGLQKIRAAR